MTDIKFHCPSCGKKLGIDAQAAGMLVTCPGCGRTVKVPDQPEATPVAPPVRPALHPPVPPAEPQPPPPPPTAAPSAPPVSTEREAVARLEKKLRDMTAERDREKARAEAAEKESATRRAELESLRAVQAASAALGEECRTLREEAARLGKALSDAEAEKNALAAKNKELQKRLDERTQQVDRIAPLEAQLAGLEADKAGLAARATALEEERDTLRVRLEAAGRELTTAAESVDALAETRRELATLAAERDTERSELASLRDESRNVMQGMALLREELKAVRQREAELEKVVEQKRAEPAPVPATGPVQSAPWEFMDPFRRSRQWIVVAAGIAAGAVISMLLFALLWPMLSPQGTQHAPAPAYQPRPESAPVTYGQPVIVDGVEIALSNARIAPVTVVSILGDEEPSAKRYLVFDVRLVNRNPGREVLLVQPWRNARMVTDTGRKLTQAFNDASRLEAVKGVIYRDKLAPGGEASDLLIFEWDEPEAASFTLSVDPEMLESTPDGDVQMSVDTFTLSIPREAVAD